MKKCLALFMSAVLLLNGTFTTVYAEDDSAETIEETTETTETAEEETGPAEEPSGEEPETVTEANPEEEPAAVQEEPAEEETPEPEKVLSAEEEAEETAETQAETEEPEPMPQETEEDYSFSFSTIASTDINAYTFFIWLSQNTSQSQAVRTDAARAAKILKGEMSESEMRNASLLDYGDSSAYSRYMSLVPYTAGYLGNDGNASAWLNFKLALDQVEAGNERRAREGLAPLKVSSVMTAMAIINANYQPVSGTLTHTEVFNAGENLYQGYVRGDTYHYYDPYEYWYDMEKQVYDYAVSKGWDPANAKNYSSAQKAEVIEECSLVNSESDVQTGHYMNLTDRLGAYASTGNGFVYSLQEMSTWPELLH